MSISMGVEDDAIGFEIDEELTLLDETPMPRGGRSDKWKVPGLIAMVAGVLGVVATVCHVYGFVGMPSLYSAVGLASKGQEGYLTKGAEYADTTDCSSFEGDEYPVGCTCNDLFALSANDYKLEHSLDGCDPKVTGGDWEPGSQCSQSVAAYCEAEEESDENLLAAATKDDRDLASLADFKSEIRDLEKALKAAKAHGMQPTVQPWIDAKTRVKKLKKGLKGYLDEHENIRCASGIRSGRVCCANECGKCGVADCDKLSGGASKCCKGPILEEDRACKDAADEVCTLPMFATNVDEEPYNTCTDSDHYELITDVETCKGMVIKHMPEGSAYDPYPGPHDWWPTGCFRYKGVEGKEVFLGTSIDGSGSQEHVLVCKLKP